LKVAAAPSGWGAASPTEGVDAVQKSPVALMMSLLLFAVACAPTNSTETLPIEVLVVLDSTAGELVMIPVDSLQVRRSIPLAGLGFTPTVLAALGDRAVVAGALPAAGAALIDLSQGAVVRTWSLLAGSVDAVAIPDEHSAYVAISSGSAVAVLDLQDGDLPDLISAPGGPKAFALARGKVFALIGNQLGCSPVACNKGPSWLVQVQADLPRDSIPLSGPGNALAGVVGTDGNLYVLSAGPPLGGGEGRLSVVDPVRNTELVSYAGVGPVAPSWIASDGGERILFASPAGGLMVFNTRERRVTLGFGNGIPLEFPTDMLTDALGRAYVLQRGGCSEANGGRIRVFGTSLIEQQPILGLECPIAGALAEVPAERIFESQP
jgi:hypothetical protein